MRLHEFIDTTPISEGPNDPYIFKAVFMAGGPGSGKSFVAKQLFGGFPGLKTLNSDDIYEILMGKADIALDPASIFSPKGQEIRNRAKDVLGKQDELYRLGRLGMIIDGTGKDVDKISKIKIRLDTLGYATMMVFVNTDIDTAQRRNMMRLRNVDPSEVQKMWSSVQQNIGRFQRMFGNDMIVYDNSADDNDPSQEDAVLKRVRAFLTAPQKKRQATDWLANSDKTNANFARKDKAKKAASIAATKKEPTQ
jgi:predicted kinase